MTLDIHGDTHRDIHDPSGPTQGAGGSPGLGRRALLRGAGVGGLVTASGLVPWSSALARPTAAAPSVPAVAAKPTLGLRVPPLWRPADRNGLVYGSSTATWQISDPDYAALFGRHAALLFTEDDLLWYRLKPTPTSPLDFTYADQIIDFAERNNQVVLGAHLVWDEGFGEGWSDDDLWGMTEAQARKVLFGTVHATVARYRGRVAVWSVVNEAIVNGPDRGYHGLRKDVPWYETIGPEYVAQAFHVAHEVDPGAMLMLNDFGYETVNEYRDRPEDKQRSTLKVIDRLLDQGAPVQAFGIQAHLLADHFHERFHARTYRRFLRELADRGLTILITEMDVLDDGLRKDPQRRDRRVADVYRRYLDVALENQHVAAVVSFGLSDRYTWLQEDYPREDGAARRPLPFGDGLRAKPAYRAVRHGLRQAPGRRRRISSIRHA